MMRLSVPLVLSTQTCLSFYSDASRLSSLGYALLQDHGRGHSG